MKFPVGLLLLVTAILSPVTATPVQRRNLPFLSLRGLTSLDHDFSTSDVAARSLKFFHESTFNPHYDGRFADTELPHHTQAFHLKLLLRSYMAAMERIGIRTWLVHGCLLGWWWNAHIMPWDADVDVMVDERSISELGNWWNMTVHAYTAQELGVEQVTDSTSLATSEDEDAQTRIKFLHEEVHKGGKKYLLEVNPHYVNASTNDWQNVIDARWIDVKTGLYIDITTVHEVVVPPSLSTDSVSLPTTADDDDTHDPHLYTKDQHLFTTSQLYPLRTTTFEDIPVQIPYAYEELLLEEYGAEALTDTYFNGYGFDPEKKEWAQGPPTEQQAIRLGEKDKMNVAGGRQGGRRKGAKKGGSQKGRKGTEIGKGKDVGGDTKGNGKSVGSVEGGDLMSVKAW